MAGPRPYDSTVKLVTDIADADETVYLDPESVQALPPATHTTNGVMTAADKTKLDGLDSSLVGKSLGDYVTTSSTSAQITAALISLLANEQDVFIPAGTWTVNPSTPFTPLSGQRIAGIGGARHGIDPGADGVSRLVVPAGFTGIDIFAGAAGVAHVHMQDLLIDLSAAAVGNTGIGINLADAGAGEEAQWILRFMQIFGPFGEGVRIGTNRRALYALRCGVFRNGGTATTVGWDMRGTDWTLESCIAGAVTANIGTALKAYGSVGRVKGGDYFGWGLNIDTATGGHGIEIGGGVGVDLAYGNGIQLAAGSSGNVNGVKFHNNSQGADASSAHIVARCLGGWSVANVTVWAESTYPNQASYVVQSGSGGWCTVDWDTVSVDGGIGSGTKGVRTAMGGGNLAPAQTFGASLALATEDVAGRNGVVKVTLTADMTPTLTAGADGQRLTFQVLQDGTGGWKVTWPANTQNFPVVFSKPSQMTSFTAVYNAAASLWVRTNTPIGAWEVYAEATAAGTTTLTLPPETTIAEIVCVGAGGGAGAGQRGLTATARQAGSGGCPGGLAVSTLVGSVLTETLTLVVGAGGTGGTANNTDTSNGANGTAGGTTSVTAVTSGVVCRAAGGSLGQGGNSSGTGVAGTGPPGINGVLSGASASSTGGAGVASSPSSSAPTGGGSGGGLVAGNTASAGGAAGNVQNGTVNAGAAGAIDTAASASAVPSTVQRQNAVAFGPGGSGGGSSVAGAAGAGASGATPGGGGGGGGASVNGQLSGAGGNGANGYIVVRIKRG